MHIPLINLKINLKSEKGNSFYCPFSGKKLIEVREFIEFIPDEDNCPKEVVGVFCGEGSALQHPYPVEGITKGEALDVYNVWLKKHLNEELEPEIEAFNNFVESFKWSKETMIISIYDKDDWGLYLIVFQPKQLAIEPWFF